ncbi:insecticide toxin TcdB-like protein [Enterobacter sp. BIGb0383]|uniref:SpvB/TcaC N-terminal domain-containing protein n=1 Tax=unclassified Enterobacter TaxID=2608935 RepID=UPI000F48AD12|nr:MULTISPECIES: SpvB/TcaC N-terminal domain-containing protein [unclassified Enterobacter]ROP50034.1 insecticide toxin TcdB-like protein [Enterobacter sp. BIGb0383]ROS06224.1 insecticide toxin TcdB-like protein [Enterobacter sp. BIGb0359]
MQNSENLALTAPSLPEGGGAISGLKGDIAAAGPDGAAMLSVPLPVSAGRGYAPPLTLNYHSRSGNGPFGMGWNIHRPAVRLRTHKGVPAYDGTDTFTGPDGEVLVPVLTKSGMAEIRSATTLLGVKVGGNYRVHAYRSRVETDFSRLEYWVPETAGQQDFWVLYRPDGQVHLLGRTAQARISHPDDLSRTAVWLEESSVSATGEQIYYQYRDENGANCDAEELAQHPAATAQRYLAAAWYGNKQAGRTLPALVLPPKEDDWLFVVVCDYGDRQSGDADIPTWQNPDAGNWPCRQDCFSSWEYGFEVRTRRLCHEILLFHRLQTLAGVQEENETPEPISRLQLNYAQAPTMTTLTSAYTVGYEADGAPCALPPLTFGWQAFAPPERAEWQQRDDMGALNTLQPYQMVDLNGEGTAGILYQDREAWWYRAPVRQPGDDADAVTWDQAMPLPSQPSLRDGAVLADFNGDGRLEWLVTAPEVAGQYARTAEREWRNFTPLSALPVEYHHPRAQLADIRGAGLADLVLIGPKSVRLYSGTGAGWSKAQTVLQPEGITLPIPGTDARVLVAFSDMAGSGQQHLVEVRAEGVCYWPNLGHGRFAPPIIMPGFTQPAVSFNPDQLFLADIDGSGTTDLIYALSDRLLIYRNQSGNDFTAPFSVSLPDGVRYERTSSLQLADIQGLGVASLILTVTHPQPRHYVCPLTDSKPWLLNAMSNGMGASHALLYRSSAQFWLDEKADAAAAGKSAPVCYLPFALHTLRRTETRDEISGNQLISTIRYRHGVWDSQEREFRGFGFVESRDADTLVGQSTTASIQRSWYATGLPEVDDRLADEYWKGDTQAFGLFRPRFTVGSGEDEQVCMPDASTLFWLRRGLKGQPLRGELFGADDPRVPYSVTEHRPQVRLVASKGDAPVIAPAIVESRTYLYERVSSDPQCRQQVVLSRDPYGQPLQQVNICYPRRTQTSASPYSAELPETLFAASFDEQQQVLRLERIQESWHCLANIEQGVWLPGLADATRRDAFTYPVTAVPAGGLSLESLRDAGTLLADSQPYLLAGQEQAWYLDAQNNATVQAPAFPPRRAFSETAVFDEAIVSALAETIPTQTLSDAGWLQASYLFARPAEASKKLWVGRQGYTTWASAAHFWQPETWRDSLLTGAVTVTRDAYDCAILQLKDAAGLTTTAEYDWRFLLPVRVTDVNDNVHAVTLDALGRVTSRRIRGTENGVAAGYSDTAMAIPKTADQALALAAPLPISLCLIYVADSWLETGDAKLPPHVVTLATDRYDSDPQQQIRQQVTFSDGFGRELQTASRQTNGEAWQRTASGALATRSDGTPVLAETTFRWAVTGRTEFDNKGQPVRVYQPYFLDSWKYVSDDSARQDLYADTHCYDSTGREWQVVTAKGWLRRTLFTPWFVVSEDENDTASGIAV